MNLFDFNLKNFDSNFLKDCQFLEYLVDIEIEKIKISDLKFIVYSRVNGFDVPIIKNILETPAYLFLKGDKELFINYKQHNSVGKDNVKRLNELLKSIKKNGYPYAGKHIILFNGQNIVRDGQHRSAVLAHLFGEDKEIEVMRFYFKNNKHKINIYSLYLKNILKKVLK